MGRSRGYHESIEYTFDDVEGLSVECTLDVMYSFTAGKYWGPWEDSYPDEHESEIELESIDAVHCAFGEVKVEGDTLKAIQQSIEDYHIYQEEDNIHKEAEEYANY
jgi:hypothetical protein